MAWAAVIGGGAALLGAGIASGAAGDAAEAQANAAALDRADRSSQYAQTRADNAPFMETGSAATKRLRQLLGLDESYGGADSGQLMRRFGSQDLANDPVYNSGLEFGAREGRDAINSRALANGGYDSGATLKALSRFGTDYGSTKANESYNRFNTDNTNIYNRLAGTSGAGQTATNVVSSAGENMTNGMVAANDAAANARAAGIVGGANSWGQGLSGVGTAANNYQSQKTIDALLKRTGGGVSSGGGYAPSTFAYTGYGANGDYQYG